MDSNQLLSPRRYDNNQARPRPQSRQRWIYQPSITIGRRCLLGSRPPSPSLRGRQRSLLNLVARPRTLIGTKETRRRTRDSYRMTWREKGLIMMGAFRRILIMMFARQIRMPICLFILLFIGTFRFQDWWIGLSLLTRR